ncbi:MAG TPA: hypothetical protein VFS43_14170 [Polyangiaceae bacterium]|nr:hypothetical protein [Polyangiaceae bacterium]
MLRRLPLRVTLTASSLGAMMACSVYDTSLLGGKEAVETGGGAGFGGQGESGSGNQLPPSEGPRGGSGGAGPATAGSGGAGGGGASAGAGGAAGAAGSGGAGGGDPFDLHPIYCELLPPKYACLNPGDTFSSFGQIYVFGRTDQNTPGAGIEAEFGYGPTGSDPRAAGNAWLFGAAERDVGFDLSLNNDQYQYAFLSNAGNTTERNYSYLFRFRVDGGEWVYCDGDGTGGVEKLPFSPGEAGYVEITNKTCAPP